MLCEGGVRPTFPCTHAHTISHSQIQNAYLNVKPPYIRVVFYAAPRVVVVAAACCCFVLMLTYGRCLATSGLLRSFVRDFRVPKVSSKKSGSNKKLGAKQKKEAMVFFGFVVEKCFTEWRVSFRFWYKLRCILYMIAFRVSHRTRRSPFKVCLVDCGVQATKMMTPVGMGWWGGRCKSALCVDDVCCCWCCVF